MNRHEAYRLLASTLEEYRALPVAELAALVGDRRSERAATCSGEEFILDVSVTRAAGPGVGIRVHAAVASPSSFRLERVKDEILVVEEAV